MNYTFRTVFNDIIRPYKFLFNFKFLMKSHTKRRLYSIVKVFLFAKLMICGGH